MRGLYACLLALSISGPAAASESDTTARAAKLEDEARAEYARGNYGRAATLFEQANRLAPFPELRYNAALSWDQTAEQARAADAYEGALRLGGLEPARVDTASSRLAALKRELAYVRVVRPLGGVVTVAHIERAPIPVDFHLKPGQHEIVVELPGGHVERRSIDARAGVAHSISIDPPPQQTLERPVRPIAKPPGRAHADTQSDGSSARTWGFVALGAGVALGGLTAYLGVRTLDEQERYEKSGFEDRDARDDGVSLRTWTNVALAGAIVSASAGGILLVVGSSSSSSGDASTRGVRLQLTSDRVIGAVTF